MDPILMKLYVLYKTKVSFDRVRILTHKGYALSVYGYFYLKDKHNLHPSSVIVI